MMIWKKLERFLRTNENSPFLDRLNHQDTANNKSPHDLVRALHFLGPPDRVALSSKPNRRSVS